MLGGCCAEKVVWDYGECEFDIDECYPDGEDGECEECGEACEEGDWD